VTDTVELRRGMTRVRGGAFRRAATLMLGCAAAAALSACAVAPTEQESERLDENTGTTVTLMPKPIELIIDRATGSKTDPFAYIGPFETNRMGSHELFLWVTAPQVNGELGVPKVFCGEQEVALDRYDGTVKDAGLSVPPYKAPAPWSAQWYFKLSGEVLDCFATATKIRVVTQAAGNPQADSYVAEGQAIAGLGTFVSKVKT
jgi:hypothetical protein